MATTRADDPAATRGNRRDAPLRRDVRLLGDALGRVLVEQEGEEFLADVERVRALARRAREIGAPADRAAPRPTSRSLAGDRRPQVLRAFALYFQLANIAEQHHRLRRRRQLRARAADPARVARRGVRACSSGRASTPPSSRAARTPSRSSSC